MNSEFYRRELAIYKKARDKDLWITAYEKTEHTGQYFLEEDGFTKGDATDEEIIEDAKYFGIDITEIDEDDEEEKMYVITELVLEKLDERFLEILEELFDEEIEKFGEPDEEDRKPEEGDMFYDYD